jgi:glycosyltransferase involved in cell wall biosynthesis
MAAGKPFLASDVDGLRDIVGGAGILFPCGKSEALANEIIKLQEDSTWYKQVAEQCQQRAMQYDISKMANSYLQIYHDIIQ